MPIRLTAPACDHAGPDGKGRNRLSMCEGATFAAQCALRPRSFVGLRKSLDTRRAAWGYFGPCIRDGECPTCPVLTFTYRRLPDAARLPFRVDPDDESLWLMHRLEDGWGERGKRWSWRDLSLALGDSWRLEDNVPSRDAHGEFFWVARAEVAR